jgi:hypothetical protein
MYEVSCGLFEAIQIKYKISYNLNLGSCYYLSWGMILGFYFNL